MLDRNLISAMNRPEYISKGVYEISGNSVRNIMPFINMESVKTVRYAVFKQPKQETD